MKSIRALAAVVVMLLGGAATAGEADVLDVKVRAQGNGTFVFDVTVRHTDTGWEHYANVWEVLGPDGAVLGTRKLFHPHVNEQPFTRSLSGVVVPRNVGVVTVRAGDSRHGFGGRTVSVAIPH